MTETIFVTGATGFIGRTLLPRLLAAEERRLKILCRRRPEDLASAGSGPEVITGDLMDPAPWQSALNGVDTVVHLAAVTGRAAPDDYERANVAATRNLLEACKVAGVRRFLQVSTIAAGYADQSFYPYAKTKAQAETLVRDSGLDYSIVRPTLVLGHGSPIWDTLSKIALLPVIPLPQKGGPVSVQPIHVEDVVRGIALLLETGRFKGETFDLGGPDPLKFSALLSKIHQAARDKPAKIFAVPLGPIRLMLALIEPILRPLMPVTAGQLAVFANDSTVTESWLSEQLRDGSLTTDEIIENLSGDPPSDSGAVARRATKKAPSRPLTEQDEQTLKAECLLYLRHLTGSLPSDYITAHYLKATAAHGLALDDDLAPFDRAVLGFARRNRLFLRWADSYCALLQRGGALRRKLVVLTAIVEHTAPTSAIYDRSPTSSPLTAFFDLSVQGIRFALCFLAGALILTPLRLVRRGAAGRAE